MNVKQTIKGVAIGAAMLGLMAAPVASRVTAQEATPEPLDLVEEMAPCGEWLGIGDATASCVVILHLAPDAPAVDVYVDGARVLANVPFKGISPYLNVPAGDRRVAVRVAGSAADSAAVIDAVVSPAAGRSYTVMASGAVANIAPVVLADNNAAPALGKGKVRVIHASPNAPAVDIAVKGGPVVVSNLKFQEASAYLELDAGSYDLEIRPAGSTTVAYPLPGVKVEAGKVASAIAIGFLGGAPGFEVLLQVDATYQQLSVDDQIRRIFNFAVTGR